MQENESESKKAEELARKNPTIATAIYYASRAIHTKELNVNGKIDTLMEDRNALRTRTERNRLILEAAIQACDELIPYYQKAKKVLENHQETDSEAMFIDAETKDEPFDFDTVEEYFKKGNFAYPLTESTKLSSCVEDKNVLDKKIKWTRRRALCLREEAIEKAIDAQDRQIDIDYVELVGKAKILGKDKNFKEAVKLLEQAFKLETSLSKEDVVWGLATTYYIQRKLNKAIKMFEVLVDKYPNNQYKFEYGTVLLNKDIQKGFSMIQEVMNETSEFDFFYKTIGDFWKNKQQPDKALQAYIEYSKKFPEDNTIENSIKECTDAIKGANQ